MKGLKAIAILIIFCALQYVNAYFFTVNSIFKESVNITLGVMFGFAICGFVFYLMADWFDINI